MQVTLAMRLHFLAQDEINTKRRGKHFGLHGCIEYSLVKLQFGFVQLPSSPRPIHLQKVTAHSTGKYCILTTMCTYKNVDSLSLRRREPHRRHECPHACEQEDPFYFGKTAKLPVIVHLSCRTYAC